MSTITTDKVVKTGAELIKRLVDPATPNGTAFKGTYNNKYGRYMGYFQYTKLSELNYEFIDYSVDEYLDTQSLSRDVMLVAGPIAVVFFKNNLTEISLIGPDISEVFTVAKQQEKSHSATFLL